MVEVGERGMAKWLPTKQMGEAYVEDWHERPSIEVDTFLKVTSDSR